MNVIFSEKTENGEPMYKRNEIAGDDNIYVTMHAKKRLKERNGWCRQTSERMLIRIYKEGIREKDFTGKQKLWVKTHKKDYFKNADYVIYGDKVYVFHGNLLITVHKAPKKKYSNYKKNRWDYLEAV